MQLDRVLLDLALRARGTPAATVAVGASHAGRGGILWLLIGPFVGGGMRLRRRDGIAMNALTVASALGLSAGLARAFGRARPCHRGVSALIPCPEGGSMPSDQAAAAFAAAEVLAWLQPGARRVVRPLAALIALSRTVVGAHYPTDVAAGAVLGTGLGKVVTNAAARRIER